MAEQRVEDENLPKQRELPRYFRGAPPTLADEVLASRCNAKVRNSCGELKTYFDLKMVVASPAAPLFTEVTPSTLLEEPIEPPTTRHLAQVPVHSDRGSVMGTQSHAHESQPKTLLHAKHQQEPPSLTEVTPSALPLEPTESPMEGESAQESVPAPSGRGFITSTQSPAHNSPRKTSNHPERQQASPLVPSFMELTLSRLHPDSIQPLTALHPAQQLAPEPPNRKSVMDKRTHERALSKTLNRRVSLLAGTATPPLTRATLSEFQTKLIEPPSVRQLALSQASKPTGKPFVEISKSCHKAMSRRLYWKKLLQAPAAAPLFMKGTLITVPPGFTEEQAIEPPCRLYGTSKQSNHKRQPNTLLPVKLSPMSPALPLFSTTAKPSTLQQKLAGQSTARQVAQKQIRISLDLGLEVSAQSYQKTQGSTLRGVKLQQALAAAPLNTKETPIALQQEPVQSPTEHELAQEEFVPPGWGFVTCTESQHLTSQPKRLHQSEYQQDSDFHLTSYDHYSRALYSFNISVATWKLDLFFVPSRVSLECTDGTVWSRARQVHLFQCREQRTSRPPTHPKYEFYGGRRALYPDQSCRRLQATSPVSFKTGIHDSRKGRRLPTSSALILHKERLSGSQLQPGRPQPIPFQTLKGVAEPSLYETNVSIQKEQPQFRHLILSPALDKTSAPHQVVGKSQETKTFQAASSLQLADNDGPKCAVRCPSENHQGGNEVMFGHLDTRKEQNLRFVSNHELFFFVVTSLKVRIVSLHKMNFVRETCNVTWIFNPRTTNVDKHAADSCLPISEQQMCKTKSQASARMRRQANVFEYITSLFRGTPLMFLHCSLVTEVPGWAMSTAISERLLVDATRLADYNKLWQDEAQSEVNALNSNRKLANRKQLSPTSLTHKDERKPSFEQISCSKNAMESIEKNSSNINAAPSMKDSFQDSIARINIAPSVAERDSEIKVAPLKRDCGQNKEPRANQASTEVKEVLKNEEKPPKKTTSDLMTSPHIEVTSSLQKMKSINQAAATKKEAAANETADETGNTSNYVLTGGSKAREMTSKPQPSLRKRYPKNEVAPSKREYDQNEESLADETTSLINNFSENEKCPKKTSSPNKHLSAQKEMTSSFEKTEPLNEAAATGKEFPPIEKSLRTDISPSIAKKASEGAGITSKPGCTTGNAVTVDSTKVATACKTKSPLKKPPPENQATSSKPMCGRNAVSPPERSLSVRKETCENEKTASKTGSSPYSSLTPGSEEVVTSSEPADAAGTCTRQPVPRRARALDLGFDADVPAPSSQCPTTETINKRFFSGGKFTFPTVDRELPSKLCKCDVTTQQHSQSRLRFSAVDDNGDPLAISKRPGIRIIEIDSVHDAGDECTLFERLGSLLNEIEQRQRETGVLANPSTHADASEDMGKKGDSHNVKKEQAHIATEMTPSVQRLRPSHRSWTDVVAGIRKTEPNISLADAAAYVQSHSTGDSKEWNQGKRSASTQLKQDGLAQEHQAVATKCPSKDTKQGDGDDARNFEHVKIGSREWIELLKKKVNEPEHREEKLLSRSRHHQSTTSREKQIKPEIIVLSFRSPSLELPLHRNTRSEVCKNTTDRKQGVRKILFGENLPMHTGGIEAVIPKSSAAPTKRPGNQEDTSDATSLNAGSCQFQEKTPGDNYEQDEANKWEWNTGRKTSTPREVPTLFQSSHSGRVYCEPNDTDASGYQASTCSVLRDVEQWQLRPHCSRSQKPHSDRYTTTRCSDREQDRLSPTSTHGVFKDESAQREALKCQSTFSYSDWLSFFGMAELDSLSISEPAVADTSEQ